MTSVSMLNLSFSHSSLSYQVTLITLIFFNAKLHEFSLFLSRKFQQFSDQLNGYRFWILYLNIKSLNKNTVLGQIWCYCSHRILV